MNTAGNDTLPYSTSGYNPTHLREAPLATVEETSAPWVPSLSRSSSSTVAGSGDDDILSKNKDGYQLLPLGGSTVTPPQENAANNQQYYEKIYTQFTNIISIAAFSGGVQAGVLAFLQALLNDKPFDIKLWEDDTKYPGSRLYSSYSLGLMLGLLSIALHLTVGAVAAVNAAIACHYSLDKDAGGGHTMKYRLAFCMIIQFMGAAISAISLVLLTLNYDWSFAVVAGFLFLGGTAVSAYHLIELFGPKWVSRLYAQPFHLVSLALCCAAFGVDISAPSRSSWFTITTVGVTVVYHMVAVLYNTSSHHKHPSNAGRWIVFLISLLWVGCSITTNLLSHWFRGEWGFIKMSVVCTLSAIEATVLFVIGVINLPGGAGFFRKLFRNLKGLFN